MKKILIAGLIAVSGITFAQERTTTTDIGRWNAMGGGSGSIKLEVIKKGNQVQAGIFVTDRHVINTNYYLENKAGLERLRNLLNETIKEMEKLEQR